MAEKKFPKKVYATYDKEGNLMAWNSLADAADFCPDDSFAEYDLANEGSYETKVEIIDHRKGKNNAKKKA